MTDKFKVGDRVRADRDVDPDDFEYGFLEGASGVITHCDGDQVPRVKFDDERHFYVSEVNFSLVESPSDELTQLRAFKEAALASGYVPAEPDKPETDDEAAERLQEEYWDDKLKRPADVALAAFAWARSNPPIDKP